MGKMHNILMKMSRLNRWGRALSVVAVTVASLNGVAMDVRAATRDLTITGSPMVFFDRTQNPTVSITSRVTVASDQPIQYASVRMFGYAGPDDKLDINPYYNRLSSFTKTWDAPNRELKIQKSNGTNFSGSNDISDLNEVLNQLVFFWPDNSITHNPTRMIEINICEVGKSYNHTDGTLHFYDYVSYSSNWSSAKTNAETKYYYGKRGYLATITGVAESQFSRKQTTATAQGWAGGSDAAVDGTWRWVTGPEGLRISGKDSLAGAVFWVGNYTPGGTKYVGDLIDYENWNASGITYTASGHRNTPTIPTEPNGGNHAEDYLQLVPGQGNSDSEGVWNDLSGTATLSGYFIEWGGMGESGNTITIHILPSNAFKSAMGM